MDGQCDVFSITTHFDCQADFTQQLAAVSADNRTTDHTVRFFVENQLGHTVCAVGSDSTTRSSPREGGGFVADAFLFRFFLSQTYPCNFWFGIGDGRDNFRIEVMFFTGDNFSGNVTFVNTFVCQHWLTDDIADSKDVRYVGTQLFVNADETSVVNFHASFACVEVFTVRHTTNRYQHGVVTLRFSGCFFAFHRHINAVFFRFNGGNFGFQHQVEFLADTLGKDFNDVFISCRDDLVEHFNHVNL